MPIERTEPLTSAAERGHALQIGPGFRRGAADFLREHRAPHAAPAGRVEAVLHGHIVIGDDGIDSDPLFLRKVGGHFEIENVPCIILDNIQNAGTAIHGKGRR